MCKYMYMSDSENFLFYLLKIGKASFENGQIIIFNATNIMFPTRSFLFLMNLLAKNYGLEESNKILREVGRFQIKQALVRYKKLFQMEKMEKRIFGNFVLKSLEC